jgi:diguanylate cyclase (GGDEF)-like protein
MNSFYKIFRLRLVLLCVAVLVVIITAIHLTVYVTTKNVIEEQLKSSAKGFAASVAYTVMDDIEGYKNFVETKDMGSDYYKKMQSYFAQVKTNSNIKYIYTERRLDADTIEFILDAEPIGSPDHSPAGSTNPNDPERESVYSTKTPTGFNFVKYETWGYLAAGYAPIFDAGGELLGIAGVNIDSSNLERQLAKVQAALFVIYALIIGFFMFMLIKYSDTILEPMLKDKLTSAYNKRYFERLLSEEFAKAVKSRKILALMMLDLDHFKNVNDTFGHDFGDKVLSSVSKSIRNVLRPYDYFIRYGGEEFAVIIADTNMAQAKEIAERIRSAVENSPILNMEKNLKVKITISIGLTCLSDLATGVKDLINSADKALYKAKITRNAVAVFEDVRRS